MALWLESDGGVAVQKDGRQVGVAHRELAAQPFNAPGSRLLERSVSSVNMVIGRLLQRAL